MGKREKGRGRKGRKEGEKSREEKEGRKLTKDKISASLLSVQLTLGLPLGLPSASWRDWKDPALL